MTSYSPPRSRSNIRRAIAITSCVFGVTLIIFAFNTGVKGAKKKPALEREASGAEAARKKPARAWNIALGNVVVVAPELGLSIKPSKGPAPEQSKVLARIESQLQSLRVIYRDESEKSAGLMGSMILQLVVDPSGEVTKVKEVSSRLSSSDFKKAVISAVSQWSFRDVLADGATIHCPLLFVREGMDITTLVQWETSFGQNGEIDAAAVNHPNAVPVAQSKITENGPQPEPATKAKSTGAEKAPRGNTAKPSSVEQLRFATSLRKEPNFSSNAVATLPVGSRVSLLGSRGEWLEVREESSGRSGFIRQEFINLSDAAKKP